MIRTVFSRKVVAALMAAAMALSGVSMGAFSASAADDPYKKKKQLEAKRERIQSALEGTNKNLADVYLKLEDTKAAVATAEADLQVKEQALAEAERQDTIIAERLDTANQQAETLSSEIKRESEAVNETKSSISQMARADYRSGGVNESLSVVLGAKTPEDFVNQSYVAETTVRIQNNQLGQLQQQVSVNKNRELRLSSVQDEIEDLKKESEENLKAKAAAQRAADEKAQQLTELRTQQSSQASQLESLKSSLEDEEASVAADQRSVEEKIRAYEAKRAKSGGSKKSGGGGGSKGSSGSLGWPTANHTVTSPYGYRVHPVTGRTSMHLGTDFRARCGVPIYAAANGTVIQRGYNNTYGNQVILDNGYIGGKSVVTSYNHFSAYNVRYGQRVSKGSVIGYSGQTGRVTGCHLHFEAFVNGSRVNPMSLLG